MLGLDTVPMIKLFWRHGAKVGPTGSGPGADQTAYDREDTIINAARDSIDVHSIRSHNPYARSGHPNAEFTAELTRTEVFKLLRIAALLQRWRRAAPLVDRWRLWLMRLYNEVHFRPGLTLTRGAALPRGV